MAPPRSAEESMSGIADSMGTDDLRNGVARFFAGEQPAFEGR